MIGLDTGFFVRLLGGHSGAVEVWTLVAEGAPAAVSCVSLYELERLALRGVLDRSATDVLHAELPVLCTLVWLDGAEGADRLRRAARLAHGNGLAMADALILTSLLDAGARTVYTTDTDMARYDGDGEVILL